MGGYVLKLIPARDTYPLNLCDLNTYNQLITKPSSKYGDYGSTPEKSQAFIHRLSVPLDDDEWYLHKKEKSCFKFTVRHKLNTCKIFDSKIRGSNQEWSNIHKYLLVTESDEVPLNFIHTKLYLLGYYVPKMVPR